MSYLSKDAYNKIKKYVLIEAKNFFELGNIDFEAYKLDIYRMLECLDCEEKEDYFYFDIYMAFKNSTGWFVKVELFAGSYNIKTKSLYPYFDYKIEIQDNKEEWS